MLELYSKESVRSGFSKGEQASFLEECLLKSGLKNFTDFAKTHKLHPKTVSDWKNEKYRMPHILVEKLSQKYDVVISKTYTKITSLELLKTAGSKGGNTVFQKYGKIGNPLIRKVGWENWWKKHGSKKPNLILQQKPVHIPKYSNDLAEFFGIMLGDGGITDYQIKVTLNSETDAEYLVFIKTLIRKIFKEEAHVFNLKNKKASILHISRKGLVEYLAKNGLSSKNKVREQADIPDWIKSNGTFSKYCLRGLYDTDGGVYFEKHKYKNKEYSYIRISFVNSSKPLLQSAYLILSNLGIPSRLNIQRSVTIEGLRNVSKYFNLVGTSNPKHLRKYENFRKLDKQQEKWQSGLTRSS